MTDTTAVGWYDGMVAAIGEDVHLEIRARTVVAATGSYERVPLVPGADRPGVVAARTAIALTGRFGVVPGERALLVGDGLELATAGEWLRRAGSVVLGPVPTSSLVSIQGSRHVTRGRTRNGESREVMPWTSSSSATGARTWTWSSLRAQPCNAAATRSSRSLTSLAGRRSRPSPWSARRRGWGSSQDTGISAPIGRASMVCFCEDVRAGEVRSEQAAGYSIPELIKRRTGALTGPCQGKYCLQSFACLVGTAADDETVPLPTARPPSPSGPPRRPGRQRRGGDVSRPHGSTLLDHGPVPAVGEVVIVGAGIGGLAFARELVARGVRDIVILERGYPGGGATGRNVAGFGPCS